MIFIPVTFCEYGEKIAHFTHYKVGECSIENYRAYDFSSTEKHDNVVEKFVDWVKFQFGRHNVELLICSCMVIYMAQF